MGLLSCGPTPLERLGGADAILERFRAIHPQIYRVYSLGLDRDAVWGQLASAFAGDALTREYVEHWTTMARMRDEGTAIDVLAVDYDDVRIAGIESDGVLVEADWSVGGIVSHQLHKHHRVNRYQAIYTLALTGDEDRGPASLHIVDTRMRTAERVATPLESGDRGFPLQNLPKSERGFLGPAELLRSGVADEMPSGPAPAGAEAATGSGAEP